MNLSILIPALNERDNIEGTIRELLSVLAGIPEIDNTKIIVIDDHSEDGTFDVVKKISDPRIVALRLSKRSGSNTAFRAGFNEITSDAVLCMSADGQDNPSCLKEMICKLRAGARVVWALRKDRKNEAWHVRLPAQIFYGILACLYKPAGAKIPISRANFFLLDKVVIDAIKRCPEKHTSLFSLIMWLGFQQDFVEYDRRERKSGKSKWNFSRKIDVAIEWITAFSNVPLKAASIAGVIILIFGVLGAMLITANKIFFGISVSGWQAMIMLLLVLSGLQLFAMGIIGEYLWRALDESRNRPLFFIEKRSGSDI